MKTISFVIPVYNEEKRLNKTFEALQELRLPHGLELEQVIFVNDGSNDETLDRIKNYESRIKKKAIIPNSKFIIQIISHRENRGKGYAVRQGMLASTSDYTLFFDADISTPLSEINKFMPYIKKGVDVIVGTRKNGKSTVIKPQPFYRQFLGRGFTVSANLILGTSFTDFTCGFKAFKASAKHGVFSRTLINRWAYDAEILFLVKRAGLLYKDVPVIWSNDENSKVNIAADIPRSLMDLLLIRFLNLDLNKEKSMLLKPASLFFRLVKALSYTYLNL